MESGREQFLKDQIEKLIHLWVGISALFGAILFIALGLLDYFVTPDNFKRFFVYRIAIALFLCLIYYLNKIKRKLSYQYTLIIAGIVASAITIEIMILQFGGHKSLYYAGINLLIVCVLGILPLNLPLALLSALSLYTIYLFPILVYDKITDLPVFINNNIFIIATIMIAFAWRILSQKSFVNEFNLQYELIQQKEELDKYSTQLEDLVAERTKELTIANQKYTSLFDNSNDGVAVLNREGTIVDVNRKFCELHGFEKDDLLGMPIKFLEAGDYKEKEDRMSRILNGEALIFETQHYRKDKSKISLEVSSKAIEIGGELCVQSIHRDITEKKRLQEQLFQSQKMESIGMLASGIAHDFNNMLTSILGNVELLHEFGNLEADAKQRVKTIENSVRKAGQMVSKIMSFIRRGDHETVPINLNDVIRDTLELTATIMTKKNIEIKAEISEGPPPVILSDANQIEQVIMNLLVNAADAMPDGGTITIRTSLVELKQEASRIHALLKPGRYAVLEISDTGTGIPDEIRMRIFDPFFTTKEHGKGTGLGLSIVYGIVKNHNGVINLKTEVGRGTTFEIYLPATDRTVPRFEKPANYTMAGRERILVVEDEPDILSFIRSVLESQGYRVLVADNPVYAQEIFREIPAEIDLVITDIVMPLVNGMELIGFFKKIKPSARIIAISGYEIYNIGKKNRDIDAFIRKPFEGIYLLSVVRRVLDTEPATTLSVQRPM